MYQPWKYEMFKYNGRLYYPIMQAFASTTSYKNAFCCLPANPLSQIVCRVYKTLNTWLSYRLFRWEARLRNVKEGEMMPKYSLSTLRFKFDLFVQRFGTEIHDDYLPR